MIFFFLPSFHLSNFSSPRHAVFYRFYFKLTISSLFSFQSKQDKLFNLKNQIFELNVAVHRLSSADKAVKDQLIDHVTRLYTLLQQAKQLIPEEEKIEEGGGLFAWGRVGKFCMYTCFLVAALLPIAMMSQVQYILNKEVVNKFH